jgi:hypothetical protein
MVLESILGTMEEDMKDLGKMGSSKERVCLQVPMVKFQLAIGTTVRGLKL